jgi:hypothetical protein
MLEMSDCKYEISTILHIVISVVFNAINITATLLPEKGQDVDVGAEAMRITTSWGTGADDKDNPVCITREGAVKGKALFGSCAVRDTVKKIASYQATIVRNQSVETLIHTPPKDK